MLRGLTRRFFLTQKFDFFFAVPRVVGISRAVSEGQTRQILLDLFVKFFSLERVDIWIALVKLGGTDVELKAGRNWFELSEDHIAFCEYSCTTECWVVLNTLAVRLSQ